jgi:hypothetical protein
VKHYPSFLFRISNDFERYGDAFHLANGTILDAKDVNIIA